MDIHFSSYQTKVFIFQIKVKNVQEPKTLEDLYVTFCLFLSAK